MLLMTVYAIGGHNYVKLRDVGEAVGFNVYWDGSSVQIESDQPYTGEPPTEPALTEESIQITLWGLKEQYPTNTYYGAYYRSYSDGPYGAAPTACAGWATLCSDAAFGDLPWRRINNPNWKDIRPGDLIRYNNTSGGHVTWYWTGQTNTSWSPRAAQIIGQDGVDSISAGGWRNSPVTPASQGIRNNRPQRQLGGAFAGAPPKIFRLCQPL